MKAIVISRSGNPDALELRDVAAPTHGPEEVLVRVRATAMNRADLLQRRGRYPAPHGVPADIPGLEFAGEIEACGERVARLRPGDRVMGILGGGGCAEQVVLHERLCIEVPPGLSWTDAAAVPEVFLTAFDALLVRGRLTAGEALLIHAAASGVGTAAAQIGSVAGARIIGLSRSKEKRRRLHDLGLQQVLDPASSDLAGEILLCSGADGVNVVLDLIGAASWSLNMEVLAPLGRVVLVGLLGGARAEVDLATLLLKRVTVVGTVMRSRALEEKIALVQRFCRQLLPLLADGRLRPVVDRVLPLEDAAKAHAVMERNEHFGKIVLAVD